MSQLEQRQSEHAGATRATPLRILSPELRQQFETLRGHLQRALWLAEKCADDEATQILRARLTNLQAAALIVIVGEVTRAWSRVGPIIKETVRQHSFTRAETQVVPSDPITQPRLRGTIALVLLKHFGAPSII